MQGAALHHESSVENPGGILEEKHLLVSVHPLLAGSYNALWPGHMVPLHGTSLRDPEGDSSVSQCSPSMKFSAIRWASVGLDPSLTGQRTLSIFVSFLGDPCYL